MMLTLSMKLMLKLTHRPQVELGEGGGSVEESCAINTLVSGRFWQEMVGHRECVNTMIQAWAK